MKVLVCGGREYDNYENICRTLDKLHEEHQFTVVIHGDAGAYKQGYRGVALWRTKAQMRLPDDGQKNGAFSK